ncbi:MAG: hypothetical protein AAFU77_16660 [Myxococcota bacterium]
MSDVIRLEAMLVRLIDKAECALDLSSIERRIRFENFLDRCA